MGEKTTRRVHLGELVDCDRCGKPHEVKSGWTQGTFMVTCEGERRLVGLAGIYLGSGEPVNGHGIKKPWKK